MRKPPPGWRYYSPTARRRWPPTTRQVLATIVIIGALVSTILIGRLDGWWSGDGQPIWEQTPWVIGLVATFLIAATTLISIGYRKTWTGFKEKKLWDWIQLLVSISIPVLIFLGGWWLNEAQKQREEADSVKRSQDAALQSYLDQMSQLLIGKDENEGTQLRQLEPEPAVRSLLAARTTTVLHTLDKDRKLSVVRFLAAAHLISKRNPVISLEGADLSNTDLRGMDLSGTSLRKADLSSANLSAADDGTVTNLNGADLSGANLRGADLSGADLRAADLRDADLSRNGPGVTFTVLRGADLSGANLSGTDVNFADFTDAQVTDEQIYASRDKGCGARMPDRQFVQYDGSRSKQPPLNEVPSIRGSCP